MSGRLDAALQELVAAIRDEVRREATAAAGAPDRLLSIPEAAAVMGIGRTALYGELTAGRMRSLKVGRRRLVPSSAITERQKKAPAPAKADAREVRRGSVDRPAA